MRVPDTQRLELGKPIAKETKFGSVFSGPLKCILREPVKIQLCLTNENIEEKLEKMWDLETIEIRKEDLMKWYTHN